MPGLAGGGRCGRLVRPGNERLAHYINFGYIFVHKRSERGGCSPLFCVSASQKFVGADRQFGAIADAQLLENGM